MHNWKKITIKKSRNSTVTNRSWISDGGNTEIQKNINVHVLDDTKTCCGFVRLTVATYS